MKKIILIFLFLISVFSYAEECSCPEGHDYGDVVQDITFYPNVKSSELPEPETPPAEESCSASSKTERYFTHVDDGVYWDRYYFIDSYYCVPCSDLDTPFPECDSNSTCTTSWVASGLTAGENTTACSDGGGTVETAKINCIQYERCKTPNSEDTNDTVCPPGQKLCNGVCVLDAVVCVTYFYNSTGGDDDNSTDDGGTDDGGTDDGGTDDGGSDDGGTGGGGTGDDGGTDDGGTDDGGTGDDSNSTDGGTDDGGTDDGGTDDGGTDDNSTSPTDCGEHAHRDFTGQCVCDLGYMFGEFEKCVKIPGGDVVIDPIEGNITSPDCIYPPENSGYKLKYLTTFEAHCLTDIQFYGGGAGKSSKNDTCPKWACYFNYQTDTNNTSDVNATIDIKPVLDKLDMINNSIKTENLNLGSKLDDLGELTKLNTKTLGDKLEALKLTNIAKADAVRSAINNTNTNLGTKLDALFAKNNKTDMTDTNDLLKQIRDGIYDLNDENNTDDNNTDDNNTLDLNITATNYDKKIKNSVTSFGTVVTDRIFNYAPTVFFNAPTGTCGNFNFSMPISGKIYSIPLGEHIDKLVVLASLFYFGAIFAAVVIVLSTV